MADRINILKNFSRNFYNNYPFPHFEIKKMYDEKTYSIFENDYQFILEKFKQNEKYYYNNIRIQFNGEEILKNDDFKKTIWFDFIKFHTSVDFFKQIIEIFYDDIIKYYPKIKNSLNNIEYSKSNFLNLRDNKDLLKNKNYDYVIDCQPGINTPVKTLSAVRGAHVDNPVELIGGLAYFRDQNDNSNGGDLILYDRKKNNIYFKDKAEVDNINDLIPVKKIEYKKNHCIFFINSEKSIHSITQRTVTQTPRYLVNFIIEKYNNNQFFKINRKNFFHKILNNLIKI